MFLCPGPTEMADVQVPEMDRRFDDIDVESILSRMERRGPLTFTRKRCLYKAPEFVQKLTAEETVEEGATVQFDCQVTGFPSPTVTWSKDDIIFGDEERAEVKQGENGVYSLCFREVSKCDEGTYRCRASNGEGVSTTSLYLSIKAKSKCRKRKKKNRAVATAPMFPAIVEHVVEERRETEEAESLPESPLTHLYDSTSKRSDVTWPEFLGEWAYSWGLSTRGEDEDLECGSEDVFESDSDSSSTPLPNEGLTFVRSSSLGDTPLPSNPAKAAGKNVSNLINKYQPHATTTDVKSPVKISPNGHERRHENPFRKESDKPRFSGKPEVGRGNRVKESRENRFARITGLAKVLKNNEAQRANAKAATDKHQTDLLNNNDSSKKAEEVSKELDKPENPIQKVSSPQTTCSVSTIIVNRSYAKGGSTTCSVAKRREDSPTKPSECPYIPPPSNIVPNSCCNSSSSCDTTPTLQNLSNQRILDRMREQCFSALKSSSWSGAFSFAQSADEDTLWEWLFFISGSSFLALYFDLPPTTFMLTIFVAIVIKFVLDVVLKES